MENTPIFIKIDDYKDVVDILRLLKVKVKDGKEILGEINTLKNEEEAEIAQWSQELIDVERKLESLERSLFQG